MSMPFEHRRSVTVQQDVDQWQTISSTKLKSRESTSIAMSNWRRRRANTVDETNSSFNKTSSIHSLPRNPLLPTPVESKVKHSSSASTSSTLSTKSSNSKPCRADKVDNWRVRPNTATNFELPSRPSIMQHERRDSSIDMLRQKSCDSSSRNSMEDIKLTPSPPLAEVPIQTVAVEVPKMLPPLRVSMEPGPIEVLPPLRFSMEPAIKGRSPWRFVLPSPKPDKTNKKFNTEVFKKQEEEEETEEGEISVDDLPYWLQGNKDDLIVRMGNSPLRQQKRPISPSQRSSFSSASSYTQQEEPALDYGSGDDESSSAYSSSASGSPDLTAREIEFLDPIEERTYVEDTMKTPLAKTRMEFALPSFTAAAPLPSHLPLPNFLLRRQ